MDRIASIGIRGLALFLDFLILSAFFFPVTRLVKGTWMMTKADHNWGGIFDPICAVFLGIVFLYFILLEGFFSRTAGKAILGLRIVNYQGSPINMKQSFIRFAGRMVDGIGAHLLGVLIMLNNEKRQRMGDKWAKTLVLKKEKN